MGLEMASAQRFEREREVPLKCSPTCPIQIAILLYKSLYWLSCLSPLSSRRKTDWSCSTRLYRCHRYSLSLFWQSTKSNISIQIPPSFMATKLRWSTPGGYLCLVAAASRAEDPLTYKCQFSEQRNRESGSCLRQSSPMFVSIKKSQITVRSTSSSSF
jgi:hypothetical protein